MTRNEFWAKYRACFAEAVLLWPENYVVQMPMDERVARVRAVVEKGSTRGGPNVVDNVVIEGKTSWRIVARVFGVKQTKAALNALLASLTE